MVVVNGCSYHGISIYHGAKSVVPPSTTEYLTGHVTVPVVCPCVSEILDCFCVIYVLALIKYPVDRFSRSLEVVATFFGPIFVPLTCAAVGTLVEMFACLFTDSGRGRLVQTSSSSDIIPMPTRFRVISHHE